MRFTLAAAVLVCCACDMKLNRAPHLANAPEDMGRPRGGVEIAAKDAPPSPVARSPRTTQSTEEESLPTDPHADRNDALQIYLRAYQLKEESPEQAIPLFKQVMALTPNDDEYHQKAARQLERLTAH